MATVGTARRGMARRGMARRGMAGALALLLALLACEDEPSPPDPPQDPSLVELDRWEWVEDANLDVFGPERPAGLVCDPVLGITEEMLGTDRVLEINTSACDYATVRQPSRVALAAGDVVAIRMFHWDLTTPAPAQAHLALAIDGTVVWEAQVPSPAAAALVEEEIDIAQAVPAGAELQLHVHNHGANSYDLVAIERVPDPADRSGS
jgi:hypothetical protein